MSGATNAFLDLAEQQIAAPRKRRLVRAAKRRVEADKEERATLQRAWSAWRRQRIAELLSGPCGEAAGTLRRFLADMKIGDAAALVTAVEAGPWRDADADTRHEILAMVDLAITLLREKSGMRPFDDAMPFGDEPLTVFQLIREHLR